MTPAHPVEWILASTNTGKLAEFQRLLPGARVRLAALPTGGTVPEETGSTFVENALIKARHAAKTTGQAALADDSGLCVDALGGAPGVHSARYAGPDATDRQNLEKLLAELRGLPRERRQAAFYCVIVALRGHDDPVPVIALGRWPGEIVAQPRGSNGFGYDSVFLDPISGRTAAELDPEQKNEVSHRGRACRQLRSMIQF